MGVTIGIDLGTTNSCAAVVKDEKPRVISDTGGGFTIPSMVAVDDKGNRLVGQPAKRQSLINPVNTIYGAKRLIGRRFQSKVTGDVKKHLLYDMAQGDNDDVLIQMAGEIYGLDEVSALIIDKVRNTAQDILEEEVTSAVVTVPAYFNDRQRQAVKDAGKIAELEVLRIINEPTAAALAYGWGKHLNERVAVYDLGGGTFDLSLLEVRDNVYEVRATGGDTFLGGVDFDNRLIEHIIDSFKKQNGEDMSKDRIALQRIKDACERAKIDLSLKQETRINIPFIAMGDDGPMNLDITVTRDEFNSMVGDLIDKTLVTCEQVLGDAEWTVNDIEDVLLVGGQTRMPYVQEKVGEFFGKQPSKNVHPDEAVAIGAALMAYSLTSASDYRITLIDVLPMSIGVALAKDKFHKIFPRNTAIPNATSMVFTTSKDNQNQLKLKICQGESDKSSENELLGEFVFSGIPPAPKGQARLEVILKLSPEGMLTVEAQDPDSKQWIETTIAVTSGLTQKTHKTKLIDKKEPPKKKEQSQPKAETQTRPPVPPPAKSAPKPPPTKPEPPKKEKTPPPAAQAAPKRPDSWGPPPSPGLGIQTKKTASGKVVLKRDPITGNIIKNTGDGDQEKTSGDEPKREFKRYHAPPPPTPIGTKISTWIKGLFGKS